MFHSQAVRYPLIRNIGKVEKVSKLSNLIMLTKQKSLSPPRNLALVTFGKLLMVVPNEVQSEPIRFNDTDVLLPSLADKSELFC